MTHPQYLAVRQLVETSWKNMAFLASTKSNEASMPFGHNTSVTTKAGDVVVTHHEAVNFSLTGAVMRVFGDKMFLSKEAADFLRLLLKQLQTTMPKYQYIQHWEEVKGRNFDDVLELLDNTFNYGTDA